MIEDEIFADALSAQGIHRTKSMYDKAKSPHTCQMCGENNEELSVGYAMNLDFVDDLNTPYLFICEDCYKELPDD